MFIFLILFSFFSTKVHASGGAICDTIFRSTNVGCDDNASSNSSGGSYPLLFDAFNFNPSALPTFPSPVGVEGYYNNKKINFALIKGVENFGFGVSSKQSNTTFFSGAENYKVALSNAKSSFKSSSLDKYINIGTAVNFFKIPELASLPIGLSYQYSPEFKKWTLNPGFEIRTSILSIGLSFNNVKQDKYSDTYYDLQEERKNISFNSSLKISNLVLGYSIIQQKNSTNYYTLNTSSLLATTTNNVTTNIVSGTLVAFGMSFTGAFRQQNASNLQSAYSGSAYKTSHTLFGANYKTDNLELGLFYNYVLNNDVSMLVKIFF